MTHAWYDIHLECGHPIRWNEFTAVPKKGGKKWCHICQKQVEIVDVDRHMVDASDYEEEMEYE